MRRQLYRMRDYLREKYAGYSMTAHLWRQEAADRDSFGPSWPLSEPNSEPIPNFQTVSTASLMRKDLPNIARRAYIEERKVRKVLKTPKADDCGISYALRIQAE